MNLKMKIIIINNLSYVDIIAFLGVWKKVIIQ